MHVLEDQGRCVLCGGRGGEGKGRLVWWRVVCVRVCVIVQAIGTPLLCLPPSGGTLVPKLSGPLQCFSGKVRIGLGHVTVM